MRFLVSGDSMSPAYSAGSKFFVSRIFYILRNPRVGDAVVLRDLRDSRLILKRIKSKNNGEYWVEGDNPTKSTDSRVFGWVKKKDIIGKVMFQYPRNKKGWLAVFIIVFAVVGLLDSLYLTYVHYQQDSILICGAGSEACNTVTASRYSVIMGVPLAVLGALFYTAVLTLVFWCRKRGPRILRALTAWAAVGFVTSMYLTYLQAFIIHAYCPLCLASAASSTFILLSTILLAKEGNNRVEARV